MTTQEISSPLSNEQMGLIGGMESVPLEALGLFFQYLGAREWFRMREVCGLWRKVVREHTGVYWLLNYSIFSVEALEVISVFLTVAILPTSWWTVISATVARPGVAEVDQKINGSLLVVFSNV